MEEKNVREKIKKHNGVAVIFAGGGGTRLWPVSRQENPKQFLNLVDKNSFFRNVVERLLQLFDPEDIFVSTTEQVKNFVRRDFPELPKENLIVEPAKRDHAPAIALATSYIQKLRGEPVTMFITWAEELMDEGEEFQRTVLGSLAIANGYKKITRIGIRPTYPATKYGYIQLGDFIDKKNGVELYKLKFFQEKPDIETAKKYVKHWDFLWNAGLWASRTDVLLEIYKKYCPEIYNPISEIAELVGKDGYEERLSEIFPKIESISIEHAITERVVDLSSEMLVVPTGIYWEDIGTWNAVHNITFKDENKNTTKGRGLLMSTESQNNFIFEEKKDKLVAIYGMKDVAIVDTDDVLLVMPLDKTENIKEIIKKLKERDGGKWL